MQGTFEPSKEGLPPVSYENFEKVPNVPSDWPLEAQVVWRDIGNVLKNAGYMTKATVFPMRRLCWAYYRTLLAEEKLLAVEADPVWEKVMDTNTKTVERLCTKFGLTPADLYRVPAIRKEGGAEMSLLK
jgi:phage terminase small subunit